MDAQPRIRNDSTSHDDNIIITYSIATNNYVDATRDQNPKKASLLHDRGQFFTPTSQSAPANPMAWLGSCRTILSWQLRAVHVQQSTHIHMRCNTEADRYVQSILFLHLDCVVRCSAGLLKSAVPSQLSRRVRVSVGTIQQDN
jgi:hypothetical protein